MAANLDTKTLSRKELNTLGSIYGKETKTIPLTAAEQIDKMYLEEKMSIKSEFAQINREQAAIKQEHTDYVTKLEVAKSLSALDGGLTYRQLENSEYNNVNNAIEAAEARRGAEEAKQNKVRVMYDADASENTVNSEVSRLAAKQEEDYRNGTTSDGLSDADWERRKQTEMFPRPEFITEAINSLLIKVEVGEKFNTLVTQPAQQKPYKVSTDVVSMRDRVSNSGKIVKGYYGDGSEETTNTYAKSMDKIFKNSGFGGTDNQMINWLKDIDRHQLNILPPNYETSDATFMTRPKLPMNSMSLRHDPFLKMFDTDYPDSIAFYIKCLLDNNWVRSNPGLATQCPMFNFQSPWLPLISNGLLSISGFPDPILETKTTEGGYHQEDQTYVKGGLGLHRSVTLNLNFKDVQRGPIMKLFEVWCEIMAQLRDGRMMSYLKYINQNTIPYSVSLYSFNLDPTKEYITNWVKATTCFPLTYPMGAVMNKAEHNRHITSAGQFTIPFMCNYVSYNKLTHLVAFNTLAERYWGMVNGGIKKAKTLPNVPGNNFKGLPYIESDKLGFKLVYKQYTD